MDVEFKNNNAKRLCNDLAFAKKKLGAVVSEKLFSNINYIREAKCFSDIMAHVPFRCHKLIGDRKDYFALDVGRKLGYRIIIDPLDENNNSLKDEKDINIIKNCTKIILVVEVTNHYD